MDKGGFLKKVLIISTFISLLLPFNLASAHTTVKNSYPAAAEVLNSSPSHVSVTFEEPLMVIKNKVVNNLVLQDSAGMNIKLGKFIVKGKNIAAAITSKKLASGSYHLKYRVVAADGHPLNGAIEFEIKY